MQIYEVCVLHDSSDEEPEAQRPQKKRSRSSGSERQLAGDRRPQHHGQGRAEHGGNDVWMQQA